MEKHLDQHLAVLVLSYQSTMTDDGDVRWSLHRALVEDMRELLTRIGVDHDVTWDQPVDRLARMSVAILNGLIVNRAARNDPIETRKLASLHAFQLASYATRNRPGT